MKVRLSACGLGNAVNVVDPARKFKFVVGEEAKEYTCSLIEACFFSRRVYRLVESDATCNVLRVRPNHPCKEFDLIVSLWRGDCISIDDSNTNVLWELNEELENQELGHFLVNFCSSSEEISAENCVSRLRLKTRLGVKFIEELEFISSNFSMLKISDLTFLGVSDLENILSHDSLRIESENSLFDFVSELIDQDESYAPLLTYIRFEYLDSEHLDKFFKSVYPDNINGVLWNSITKFISHSAMQSPVKNFTMNKRFVVKGEVFQYSSASPFGGIISHLSHKSGNPHERGIISITASSNARNMCHQVVNYGWDDYWCTNNQENSWIQFDFKDRPISPESYTIKSDDGHLRGLCHLIQWKIEGSNDATVWTELDNKNVKEADGIYMIHHFVCSRQFEGKFFRYIRLRQTGRNAYENHYLVLSQIEFFGTLKSQNTV